jgi:MOSC domain-containing protein YiiM
MGEVARLFRCLVHRFPMEELSEVEAVANKGFKGCIHGRPGSKRQVSLMDVETLEKLGVAPGLVKENITTRAMDFQALGTGQILRVGEECVLEITGPCHPCPRMDEVRMGLQEELRGQRGWLCKVTVGGRVRRGDRIEVMEMATETAAMSTSPAAAN